MVARAGDRGVKTAYSSATKAAAMAALLAGQAIPEVARAYSLPLDTVKSWRQRMRKGAKAGAPDAPTNKAEVGELLLGYLHTNLATLKAQAEVFADPTWLRKQDAGELAVLHGVMTDKAIRLLESLGGANNR